MLILLGFHQNDAKTAVSKTSFHAVVHSCSGGALVLDGNMETPFFQGDMVNVLQCTEPSLAFGFNDNPLGPSPELEYCANEEIIVFLAVIIAGQPPFTVHWEVNEVPDSASGVEVGD
ncbi:MAG: hypothetical protein EA409_06505, partial [Saprospirales bacterium]